MYCSLIKMLYYMCKESKSAPSGPQLEHAIKRNFGGLESEKLDPYQEFLDQIPKNRALLKISDKVINLLK